MNKENKKTRYTLKRAVDDLIVGSVIGYVIAVIIVKVLDVRGLIQYDNVQPVMIIAAVIIFVICFIRYRVEKVRKSQQ